MAEYTVYHVSQPEVVCAINSYMQGFISESLTRGGEGKSGG